MTHDMTQRMTLPDQIRAAFKELAPDGQPVVIAKIALAIDLIQGDDKRAFYSTIRDMVRRGEIERLEKGVIRYRGRDEKKPDIKSAMWAVLRMKRSVTISDLEELSGSSKEYAKEFMNMLADRGSVEKITQGGRIVYRLVEDSGPETPMDTKKAEKLRRIRESKKRALAEIDAAGEALMTASHALVAARMLVSDMGVDNGND